MNEIKEVTIVHGLPDTNSGGAALGISLVRAWRNSYPDTQINYVSYHTDKEVIELAHPFMLRACPDVRILPSYLKGRLDFQHIQRPWLRKISTLFWGLSLIFSLFYLIFPKLADSNEACRAIYRSDLVLSRGTQIFYDKPGYFFRGLAAMYWMLFPLLYAKRVRTQYVIYAQSFGPLHRWVSRTLVRYTFKDALFVLAREEVSRDFLLHTLKLDEAQVGLVPDSVFALEPRPPEEVAAIAAKYGLPLFSYMSVTIRTGMQGEKFFLPDVARVIDEVLRRNVVEKCVIVTQSHKFEKYEAFECDSEISRLLADIVEEKDKLVIVDEALTPDELIGLYGGGAVTLGMRLHSVIFSLVAGTPAVALSYWGPKTPGIMAMAGLQNHMFNIDEFQVEQVVEIIQQLCKDKTAARENVRRQADRLHAWAMGTPLLIGKRLGVD